MYCCQPSCTTGLQNEAVTFPNLVFVVTLPFSLPGAAGDGVAGVRNCLLARQLCADDISCHSVLEIIPRLCGPENGECSTDCLSTVYVVWVWIRFALSSSSYFCLLCLFVLSSPLPLSSVASACSPFYFYSVFLLSTYLIVYLLFLFRLLIFTFVRLSLLYCSTCVSFVFSFSPLPFTSVICLIYLYIFFLIVLFPSTSVSWSSPRLYFSPFCLFILSLSLLFCTVSSYSPLSLCPVPLRPLLPSLLFLPTWLSVLIIS